MLFADDTTAGLVSAVALVNSAVDPDSLLTPADVADFYTGHGYTGRHDGTRAEVERLRAIRPRLRALLSADPDAVVRQVNEVLAEARALPRLVRHGDTDWHLHAVGDEEPLPTRVLVETAMAMIDLVRAGELSRIGTCADERCDGLVLDLTRNRSRRYCSTACTNRNAVAAYRRRRRG